MKKFLFIISLFFHVFYLCAQKGNLEVETHMLSNGMKVLLCEDHSAPEIYGGILVHVGSKNDPADATGMAHYFEHIMFKGTDKIGTIDWEAEKPYLDSISYFYDQLHQTQDSEERSRIQKIINELSIASAQFAIPNEVDAILGKMGGKGINAYTSHDVTVYYNRFPSNQLEKWMNVYAERFRNPVFRLFQSELETVYEEKNMYADNPFERVFEDLMKTFFGNHPYARPIIGYTEHLKNPQISKLEEFFQTYYVSNNMTLFLVGDFNAEEAKKSIEKVFGILPQRPLPEEPAYTIPELNGRVEVTKRLTPIKAGVLAYKTVTANHPDHLKIELMLSLFNNNSNTGLIDRLMKNNKMYMAQSMQYSFKDLGVAGFVYVPKILGQSLNGAEEMIMHCLDSVRQGNFSDALFNAVKKEFLLEHVRSIENLNTKTQILIDAESRGSTWQDYISQWEMIDKMTKQDIVEVANRYFGDDYLAYRTKMGFPKKDKIDKPDWKPVIPQNADTASFFAQSIEQMEVTDIPQQIIDFEEDVFTFPINDYTLYASPNPFNDVFTLLICFDYGTNHDPHLKNAAEYFNNQGTRNKTYDQFTLALQQLGSKIMVRTQENSTCLYIQGFEDNIEDIMKLCSEKLHLPGNDEKYLKIMRNDKKMDYRMYRFSPSSWSHLLYEYVNYGKNSSYLRCPSIREVKKYTGDYLLSVLGKAMSHTGYVAFTGNSGVGYISDIVRYYIPFNSQPIQGDYLSFDQLEQVEDEVYYIHNRKALQSRIYFNIIGEKYISEREKVLSYAFNKYFGSDMFSIVFQEIREFRSLGYSARSFYNYSFLNRTRGYLYAFLGTQSDKTLEGISVMKGLMQELPEKPEKFEIAKKALLKSNASSYITFRNIPVNIRFWKLQGYYKDPRPLHNEYIASFEMDDIMRFFQTNITDRPVRISFSGNMQRIDKKQLSRFGKLQKVRFSKIYKR